jgi:hypothetical protein
MTFGFTTHTPGGGFAGKYSTTRAVEVTDASGNFDVEIPLSEFQSVAYEKGASKKQLATSPVGQELVEWWCSTRGRKVSLAIAHVELVGPASTSLTRAIGAPAPVANLEFRKGILARSAS